MTQRSTTLRREAVLNDATINKGTAFELSERDALGLDGLLPPRVETLAEQLMRTNEKYGALHHDLERHVFLRALQDNNEVLFYAFMEQNLVDLLPIVYTPTVGEACAQFSHIYRRPHGLFLSYWDRDRLEEHIANYERDVDVIVVTDGERILGLGDQGLGGMGIPIGKLSLYTSAGGIDPAKTLPILLDVGTDNAELRSDPLYLGEHLERIRGKEYDDFVEQVVTALKARFPKVLLQWEDFASVNAPRLLKRYRDELLTFNDDIQGTAAVAMATVVAALKVTGADLADQRILLVGAGSAGTGIADMLVQAMIAGGAAEDGEGPEVYLTDKDGLLHVGRADLAPYQQPFVQSAVRTKGLEGVSSVATIVETIRPTVIIGVSGQPGLIDEAVVRAMTAITERPVIMPLSNPTSRAEATPADVLRWSDGKALVATGSPFDAVDVDGTLFTISQANNVYVFPGLGLGALVANATAVTDSMLIAAANAVASDSHCNQDPSTGILPPLDAIQDASRRIAVAVAVEAGACGVGDVLTMDQAKELVDQRWWSPNYPVVVPAA